MDGDHNSILIKWSKDIVYIVYLDDQFTAFEFPICHTFNYLLILS